MSIEVYGFDPCKGPSFVEPLSQVTFQSIFDLAVPARESSEFVGGKRSGPKAVILTAERDESGSSKGSLHGCVCEINLRGQLELGGEDRWRMWSSVFSAGRDGVWRCAKSAWRNSWQSDKSRRWRRTHVRLRSVPEIRKSKNSFSSYDLFDSK